MGRQSYIAKFRETLIETNFHVNKLNLLYFLKNTLLQYFEQIGRTEFCSFLKFPHRYEQQYLRDNDNKNFSENAQYS